MKLISIRSWISIWKIVRHKWMAAAWWCQNIWNTFALISHRWRRLLLAYHMCMIVYGCRFFQFKTAFLLEWRTWNILVLVRIKCGQQYVNRVQFSCECVTNINAMTNGLFQFYVYIWDDIWHFFRDSIYQMHFCCLRWNSCHSFQSDGNFFFFSCSLCCHWHCLAATHVGSVDSFRFEFGSVRIRLGHAECLFAFMEKYQQLY